MKRSNCDLLRYLHLRGPDLINKYKPSRHSEAIQIGRKTYVSLVFFISNGLFSPQMLNNCTLDNAFIDIHFKSQHIFARLKITPDWNNLPDESIVCLDFLIDAYICRQQETDLIIPDNNQTPFIVSSSLLGYNPKGSAMAKPYLLTGPHKAGTTLLEAILNSHPDTICFHESNIFNFASLTERQYSPKHLHKAAITNLLFKEESNDKCNELLSLARILEGYFANLMGQFNYYAFGDRSPNALAENSQYITSSLANKSLLMIFIQRNIEETILSLLDHADNFGVLPFSKESFFHDSPTKEVVCWLKASTDHIRYQIEQAEKLKTAFKENILLISYSDLCENPTDTIKDIFKFIGLSCDDLIVKNTVDKTSFEKMRKGSYINILGPKEFLKKGGISRKKQISDIPSCLRQIMNPEISVGS